MDSSTLTLQGVEVSCPTSPREALWDLLQRLASDERDEDPAALAALAQEAKSEREWAIALLSGLTAARSYYERHALEEGRAHAIAALELARETGNVLAEAHAYRLLALVAFDQGRSKDGHDHLLDAMAAFEDAGRQHEVPTLTRWYAEHLAVLGAKAEAEAAFQLARRRFLAVGDEEGARLCELDLAAMQAR